MKNLRIKNFSQIDLEDPFFDSLKEDYAEFTNWFEKKQRSQANAYTCTNSNSKINGFLYMKIEEELDNSITPSLPNGRTVKLGTLKIEARGTKLGERFIKKVFDYALDESAEIVYVTIFEKHRKLVELLRRYGFEDHGQKITPNGTELVLVKKMGQILGTTASNFPNFTLDKKDYYLLAIYPEYHSSFLPDSILKTEDHEILKDLSHTNSIHKAYISGISRTKKLRPGDILVIYRTNDGKGKAYYRSVATSIGVVEEVRQIKSFGSSAEFISYAQPYSIFTREELKSYFTNQGNRYIIRFTYNAALKKRIIRKRLIEECNISTRARWDFLKLSKTQIEWIAHTGQINENIIIN